MANLQAGACAGNAHNCCARSASTPSRGGLPRGRTFLSSSSMPNEISQRAYATCPRTPRPVRGALHAHGTYRLSVQGIPFAAWHNHRVHTSDA